MVCGEDTFCMVLNRQGYEQIIGRYQKQKINEKVSYFSSFSFLSKIPTSIMIQMFNSIREVRYSCGQAIYKMGDPIDQIYFVRRGQVEYSVQKSEP